jgi:hypothetical protein
MQKVVLNKALVVENNRAIEPALRSRQFFFDVDCLLRSGAGFITRKKSHATRIVKINATR